MDDTRCLYQQGEERYCTINATQVPALYHVYPLSPACSSPAMLRNDVHLTPTPCSLGSTFDLTLPTHGLMCGWHVLVMMCMLRQTLFLLLLISSLPPLLLRGPLLIMVHLPITKFMVDSSLVF